VRRTAFYLLFANPGNKSIIMSYDTASTLGTDIQLYSGADVAGVSVSYLATLSLVDLPDALPKAIVIASAFSILVTFGTLIMMVPVRLCDCSGVTPSYGETGAASPTCRAQKPCCPHFIVLDGRDDYSGHRVVHEHALGN
jgi:hypothetical protein